MIFNKSRVSAPCPCQSGHEYSRCCAVLHQGGIAESAEVLMRSRYSAYVYGLETYLRETWHTSTRPAALNLAERGVGTKWLGLTLKRAEPQSEDTALVEYVARYRQGGGKAGRLHELGRFKHEQGRWYYLDGELLK